MDLARARKHMVDSQVRPNDVPDRRLQSAMERLPREAFVPANRRHLAYVEADVPLFEDRWLLKARDLSKLIHGAQIQEGDLVLDVGCGYGYSSALMAALCGGGVVVGLEEDEGVVSKATETFTTLGIDNAVMVEGKLPEGCEKQGPYDVIMVAGGVRTGWETLLSQLKPDVGRMVAIVMERGVGQATLFTRAGDSFGRRRLFEAHPPGLLPGFNNSEGFVF